MKQNQQKRKKAKKWLLNTINEGFNFSVPDKLYSSRDELYKKRFALLDKIGKR